MELVVNVLMIYVADGVDELDVMSAFLTAVVVVLRLLLGLWGLSL